MATISNTPRPGYVWDSTDNVWYPIGVGAHAHTADAVGAIANTLTTTTGDIIYASAANTPARLGIGSTGQVLKVAGGVPAWSSDNGKVLQVVNAITTTATTIATTSMTDTTITATITPTSATSKILVMVNGTVKHEINAGTTAIGGQLMRGATVIQGYSSAYLDLSGVTGGTQNTRYARIPLMYMDSPATTSATTYKLQGRINDTANSGSSTWQHGSYTSSIVLMEIGA